MCVWINPNAFHLLRRYSRRMKTISIYSLAILLLFGSSVVSAADRGTLKVVTIASKAIAGNPMKISADREVAVYLPPGYASSGKRYPVLYLLHGTGDGHLNFVDDPAKFANIQDLLETGVAASRFGEMIVVTPNEQTPWGGSFYVNSATTGNWEDFTAVELVGFIDANFRTLPKSGSRAIAGHSMGGFGAVSLAMKHPDVFGSAYAMNGGFLSFDAELNPKNPDVGKFVRARTPDELLATNNRNAIGMMMVAQAFSPNPDTLPFLADKPYKLQRGKLVPNRPAYDIWLEFDVVRMAEKYQANLRKLRAIKFDCGDDEELEIIEVNSRRLSAKLTALGVTHQFEQYNGDHRNRLWGLNGRIYNDVLPFVFDNLER